MPRIMVLLTSLFGISAVGQFSMLFAAPEAPRKEEVEEVSTHSSFDELDRWEAELLERERQLEATRIRQRIAGDSGPPAEDQPIAAPAAEAPGDDMVPLGQLARMYAEMDPDAAASALGALTPEEAAPILRTMTGDRVGPILGAMPRQKMRAISKAMASSAPEDAS